MRKLLHIAGRDSWRKGRCCSGSRGDSRRIALFRLGRSPGQRDTEIEMKFVFYQNFLSIHQAAFLNALAFEHEVVLITQKQLDTQRQREGWEKPVWANVEIHTAISDQKLEELQEKHATSFHVFSGITAEPMIHHALRNALHKHLKILLYMEPYVWNDKYGILRYIKYSILAHQLRNRVFAVLPTGEIGVKLYRRCGFSTEQLFAWGYFTRNPMLQENAHPPGGEKCRLLFIGRLDRNKNCQALLEACQRLPESYDGLTIIGSGEEEHRLKQYARNMAVNFIGNVPNEKVFHYIQTHDILILPSRYDGWGAVVNEALSCGTRVVVSENCGAACLVGTHAERGEIFRFHGEDNLENVLRRQLARGVQTPEQRQALQSWARTHISGETAAEYFSAICLYLSGRGERPIPPWREGE